MAIQTLDRQHLPQKARQIRAQVAAILTRWELPPRFKRWRLTQDPGTGMVVLFGVLNSRYIAAHTSIPFNDYFDPRVLRDLANELQVQVVSCNSDGLRYAFILDRGKLDKLPTHIDFPYIENGKVLARVVYSANPPSIPAPLVDTASADGDSSVSEGWEDFLKVFDDIKLSDDAALQRSDRTLPEIVVIDEDEFKKRVAEHEANPQNFDPRVLRTR